MMFVGRIWKDGSFWLVEVGFADVLTQGRTRREAVAMLGDAIESLVNKPGFSVAVTDLGGEDVLVKASEPAALVALALKRQREKSGLSLADVARALNQASRNSYARYEQGTSIPSIEKIDELFRAVAPETPIIIGMRARTLPSRRRQGAPRVKASARAVPRAS